MSRIQEAKTYRLEMNELFGFCRSALLVAGADVVVCEPNFGLIRAVVPRTAFTYEVYIQLEIVPLPDATTVQYASEWMSSLTGWGKDKKAAENFWVALDHVVSRATIQMASQTVQTIHAPQGLSIAEELRQLDKLVREGVLTHDDFERAKEVFLGKAPDKREQTVQVLRSLYDLTQKGVLSQSEFNIKKWDILSKPGIG
jgi:hypothetical protein